MFFYQMSLHCDKKSYSIGPRELEWSGQTDKNEILKKGRSYKTFFVGMSPFGGMEMLQKQFLASPNICRWSLGQGILKGEVSLYHWPPVWLVWNSLFCKYCQLSYSWFQTRQTGGQQYSDTSPFSIPCLGCCAPLRASWSWDETIDIEGVK